MSRLAVPAAVILLVERRSGGRCEMDGLPFLGKRHLHHRQPRGMGSSTGDPHAVENLLALHPMCHLNRVERHRAEAYDYGWLVRHGYSPAEVPVFTHRGWYWPTSEGGWRACTPEEAARLRRDGAHHAEEDAEPGDGPRTPEPIG